MVEGHGPWRVPHLGRNNCMHCYRWEVELLERSSVDEDAGILVVDILDLGKPKQMKNHWCWWYHGFFTWFCACWVLHFLRLSLKRERRRTAQDDVPSTLSLLSSYNIHPGDWPQMPTVFPEHICSSPWIKLKVEDSVPLQKLSSVLRKHKQQAREQVECILLQLPPWSFAEFPLHSLMVDLSSVFTEPVSPASH